MALDLDKMLIKRILEGVPSAYNILVLKYQPRIKRVISRYIRDPAMVNDITQESFIRAYKSLNMFKGTSSFYTWLYRIAVNVAKNYLKLSARKAPNQDIDFIESERYLATKEILIDIDSPEQNLIKDEVQQKLVSSLDHMQEELRESFLLREIGGYSYLQIADIMKCPVNTVRTRIFRARNIIDKNIKWDY